MTRTIELNGEVQFLELILHQEFVPLYKSWRSEKGNGAVYALLSPSNEKNDFLSSTSWPLHIGDGYPGFSAIHRGENIEATYHPGNSEGLIPLVFVRSGEGMLEPVPEPLQEMIHYHNLLPIKENHEFIKILENGETEIVIRILPNKHIEIKTSFLLQFQAARQMDLMFELDSVQFVDESSEVPSEQSVKTQDMNLSIYPLDSWSQLGYRALGKVIFSPQPPEFSGIWPFESTLEIKESFSILNADGQPIDVTLNSIEKLDPNDFLRKQGVHYLESVQFHKNVMQRYFAYPDIYEVKDGILKCGHLWSLSIDNDHQDNLFVYLGDLLRDLPAKEWKFWKPYNLVDGSKMSETSYKRNILGQIAEPMRADLRFRAIFQVFQQDWAEKFGWDLFLPLTAEDDYVFKSLHIPSNDSFKDFDTFSLYLAKLLTGSLNTEVISRLIGISLKNKKVTPLDRLQIWLEKSGFEEYDKVRDSLHMIQWLRSNSAAHPKERDVNENIRSKYGFFAGRDFCEHLCDSASGALNLLSEYFLLP